MLTKIAEKWARTGSFSRALKEKGETLIYGRGDKLIVEYPGGEKTTYPAKTSLHKITDDIDEYYKTNSLKDGKMNTWKNQAK